MKVLLKKRFVGPVNSAWDPWKSIKAIETCLKKKYAGPNSGLFISIQTSTLCVVLHI